MNFENTYPSESGQSQFARGPGSAGSYAWFTSNSTGVDISDSGGWNGAWLGPVDGPLNTWEGIVDASSLLARIYVTTGGDVAFEGTFLYRGTGEPSMLDPLQTNLAFSTAVPEPSAAALLATGLIGVGFRALAETQVTAASTKFLRKRRAVIVRSAPKRSNLFPKMFFRAARTTYAAERCSPLRSSRSFAAFHRWFHPETGTQHRGFFTLCLTGWLDLLYKRQRNAKLSLKGQRLSLSRPGQHRPEAFELFPKAKREHRSPRIAADRAISVDQRRSVFLANQIGGFPWSGPHL